MADLVDGRFRVEQQIGAGGMGVVYRAVDEQTGARVALKLIRADNAEEIQRAIREIDTLARLDHPGIVHHIKDGLTDDGQLYLVMQWIDGITVAERLATDGFTLREAITLCTSVAFGLAAAHAANVVHRDVKPSNVMLEQGQPGRAKLIDFGLARGIGATHKSITRTGTTVGTPGYMSPEQARGLRLLDPASDVFNLGLLLYECATGRTAFQGANFAALLLSIVLAEPVPISVYCPEAPPELDELVGRLLAKDPRARPQDGAAALAELGAVASRIPEGPRRDSNTLLDGKTRVNTPEVHCLVLAARGFIDDIVDPPLPAELAHITSAAAVAGSPIEVLANGTLAAHFHGPARAIAHQAAELAIDLNDVLANWTFAISTAQPELSAAAEEGTGLLLRAVKAAMFARAKPAPGISIDPQTAKLVEDVFVVAAGSPPRLTGRRE